MIDYFDLGIQNPDTGKNLGAKYHVCDMCGARIEPDMPRYGLKMSVFAAYDTLENAKIINATSNLFIFCLLFCLLNSLVFTSSKSRL